MFVTGLLRRSSLTHDLHTFVMRSLIRKKMKGESELSGRVSEKKKNILALRLAKNVN